MKRTLLFFLLLAPIAALAAPDARISVPQATAWTGQNLAFYIELRAEGSFAGSPVFDLPDLPRTVIIKTGRPVISSETRDGTEIFVQRHGFTLFSQADGKLEIPPIAVRYSHHKGYTGPTYDETAKTTATTLTINRPPGSEKLGFLVTTAALEIEETWEPTPGPAKVGAVFKRTITQRAADVAGMALSAAPDSAPDGVRVYPGEPKVNDGLERSEMRGEREETLTYLVQKSGELTLPAIRYDWWNPESKTLESKTLEAVTFTVTAPPIPPVPRSPWRFLWLLPGVAVLLGLFLYRHRVASGLHAIHERLDPPGQRAARAFLKACHLNDAPAAARAWSAWQALHPDFSPDGSDLLSPLIELRRHLYGPAVSRSAWDGHSLAAAFKNLHPGSEHSPEKSSLPPLNA